MSWDFNKEIYWISLLNSKAIKDEAIGNAFSDVMSVRKEKTSYVFSY